MRTLAAEPRDLRAAPDPVQAHRERHEHLRLVYETPSWLLRRIRKVIRQSGTRGRSEFDFWQQFRDCHWTDHSGTDLAGNFVAEPYGKTCSRCREMVDAFCRALHLEYQISTPAWHGPVENLIRITILKPSEASE